MYNPYQEEWLRLDFNGSARVGEVAIDWDDNYCAANYSIWVWKNNRWIMVDSDYNHNGGSTVNRFNPVTTRGVLIKMRDGYRYIGINEVVVK